jgi:hypothetical protein
MNDKALYQLERAIDALTQMAKYMREEQAPSTPVKFNEHMGVFAPYTYYTESRTDYNSTGGVNVTL